MTQEYEGYRKFRADQLPLDQQRELRQSLQHDITEALIRSIRESPPEIDLSEVELVLRPGETIGGYDVVADCVTCVTCGTCGTCGTS